MSVLVANLKHLYQRRIGWFLVIPYLFLCFAIIMTIRESILIPRNASKIVYIFVPAIVMFVGALTSTYALDIINKPLAYCLPGHRKASRRFLLVCGLALCTFWSICYSVFFDLSFIEKLKSTISGFALLSFFYWLIAVSVVVKRNNTFVASLIFGVPIVDGHLMEKVGVPISLYIVQHYPLWTSVACIIVCLICWWQLGRESMVRNCCGKTLSGLEIDESKVNREVLRSNKWKYLTFTSMNSLVEKLFLKLLNKTRSKPVLHCVVSNMYQTFGFVLSFCLKWTTLLWFAAVAVAITQIWVKIEMRLFVLYLPFALLLGKINPVSKFHHLLTGGRREKFLSAISTAVSVAALVLLISLVIMSIAFGGIDDQEFSGVQYVIVVLAALQILVPLLLSLKLMFGNNRLVLLFTNLVYIIAAFIGSIVLLMINGDYFSFSYKYYVLDICIVLFLCWYVYIATCQFVIRPQFRNQNIILAAVLVIPAVIISAYILYMISLPVNTVNRFEFNYYEPAGLTDETNAYTAYKSALVHYDNTLKDFRDSPSDADYFPEYIDALKNYLNVNSSVLAELQAAVKLPDNYYTFDYEADLNYYGYTYKYHSMMECVLNLLSADVIVNSHEGNIDKAIAGVGLLLDGAEQVYRPEATYSEQRFSRYFMENANRLIGYILWKNNPDLQQVQRMKELYRLHSEFMTAAPEIESCRQYYHNLIAHTVTQSDDMSGRLSWKWFSRYLRATGDNDLVMIKRAFYDSLFGIREKEMYEVVDVKVDYYSQMMDEIFNSDHSYLDWINEDGQGNEFDDVYSMFSFSPKWVVQNYIWLKSDHIGTLALLAIKEYEAEHGELPVNFKLLVNYGYLDGAPIDVYSGKELKYRVKDDDFVLYSVGRDGDDDYYQYDSYGSMYDELFWNMSDGSGYLLNVRD